MSGIVIIGTGLAGYSTAREFRKLDRDTALTLLTADDGRAYSKPNLSSAFTNGKSPDELATADAGRMAEQLNAEIRTGVRVGSLDLAGRRLAVDGQSQGFDRLVLALGADPIRLPLQGDGAAAVLSVNDLGDYTAFRSAVQGAGHVAILGAGLIGCEFANDLHRSGIRSTLIDPAPYPLNRLLPEAAGGDLERGLAGIGVDWRLNRSAVSVERRGTGFRLILDDGSGLDADQVLSAVGLRPRTDLALAAGLAVNRGVVVDRHLRSRDPQVYALGDCAEVEGLVLPFVMPIMQASRALAQTLAGNPTPVRYPAMPVVVKTSDHPVVVSPPLPGLEGEWSAASVDGGVRALFHDPAGRLAGFALTGAAVSDRAALTRELPAWLE